MKGLAERADRVDRRGLVLDVRRARRTSADARHPSPARTVAVVVDEAELARFGAARRARRFDGTAVRRWDRPAHADFRAAIAASWQRSQSAGAVLWWPWARQRGPKGPRIHDGGLRFAGCRSADSVVSPVDRPGCPGDVPG
ncbi:hypothetical protein [Mycobacteroides abscessus]|uniref:hypothetical protein n=1 Tax=Mycobacteroides abscessus TaxID=36809 RepID=UPI0009432362|nr:hypothetical protein [Mycobacteroides abscessus]OTR26378.1 hypothetical protein B9M78_21920 [Mycobacteroides abscessus]